MCTSSGSSQTLVAAYGMVCTLYTLRQLRMITHLKTSYQGSHVLQVTPVAADLHQRHDHTAADQAPKFSL